MALVKMRLLSNWQNIVHEKIATPWSKAIVNLSRCKMNAINLENLVTSKPVIIVSNHQSLCDLFIYYSILPIQFRWLAKSSVFKIPLIGTAMKSCGYVPVASNHTVSNSKEILNTSKKLINNGCSIIIYPEGTRSQLSNNQLLPFKKGACWLAKKTKTIIQPITINGSNKIMPKQKSKLIQRVYPGNIKVTIHPPIYPNEFKDLSLDEMNQHLRKIITEPLSNTNYE